jgi:cell division septal protein FtsQ
MLRPMAQPARRQAQAPETPPLDPSAVQRAYRLERAKRRARERRALERRLAALRFAVVLVLLLALSAFITLTAWQQIQRLFGL